MQVERNFDDNEASSANHQAARLAQELAENMLRPFFMHKAKIVRDGSMWVAILGSDIHSGVSAYGDTPELASRAFDIAWTTGK